MAVEASAAAHVGEGLVPGSCPKCGLFHRSCSAHNREGKPCGQTRVRGLRVCRFHGGWTTAARAAGQRNLALAKAGELLGVPLEVDAGAALVAAVHEAAGNVEFLRAQVQAYQLQGGELGRVTAGDQLVINATLELYNRERDRLADYCRLAIQAGVAERQVKLAELQGALLAGVVAAVLSDPGLGLTPVQQAVGRQVAARVMVEQSVRSPAQNGPLLQGAVQEEAPAKVRAPV